MNDQLGNLGPGAYTSIFVSRFPRKRYCLAACGQFKHDLHNFCSWVSNPDSGLGSWLRDRLRIDPWWAS